MAYAVLLGMPEDSIGFTDYGHTAYGGSTDILKIGTDVLPLGIRLKNPNSNISLKGAIAHEIIGHRDAALGKFEHPVEAADEAQASIRAARFAPDLSRQERMDLLKDAMNRLRTEGIRLRDVKKQLRINER
jgi:hypothetical protein